MAKMVGGHSFPDDASDREIADFLGLPAVDTRSPRLAAHLAVPSARGPGPLARSVLNAMPGVMGGAGGAIGLGGGSVFGLGFGGIPGAIGGGALGAAGGEAIRELGLRALGGEAPETASAAAWKIAGGGALGGVTSGLAAGPAMALGRIPGAARMLLSKFLPRGAGEIVEGLGQLGERAAARGAGRVAAKTTQPSVRAAAKASAKAAAPTVRGAARKKVLPGPVRGGTRVMPGGVTNQLAAEQALVDAGFTVGERATARKLLARGVPLQQILGMIRGAQP